MPQRKHIKKGGGVIQAPSCAKQVDISRYTRACSSGNQLPLDGLFAKHFATSQSGGKHHKSKRHHKHKKSSKRKSVSKRKSSKRKRTIRKKKTISGGGFSVLPDVNVGNRPEIRGYSDCCPPVFTKDGIVQSTNHQPLCGQQGGSKNKKRKVSKSKKGKKGKKRYQKKGGGVTGMSGANGNFSGDMTTRQFGCNQPFWKPNCV